jgi:predicted dehydrogenase
MYLINSVIEEAYMSIGWGIIGTGGHADTMVAPAIKKVPGSSIIAAYDIKTESAQNFAARHSVENVYDSLDKMLKDPDIDSLYIATPNYLHSRLTIQAAEAGKHVLCEKPMALTIADGELMVEACRKNNVKLGVSFPERFHPAHQEARRLIRSGEAGEITLVKAQFCRGGARGGWRTWSAWRIDPNMVGAGALYGQGLHVIDALRFILDSEVAEVCAITDETPPDYPVDDMAYVIIKFENGLCGTVVCGMLAPRSENDAVFYGSNAKITCKGTLGAPLQGTLGELLVDGNSVNIKMNYPSTENPTIYRLIREIESFSQSIENDTDSGISGLNGLQMVRIGTAILESSRKGKRVKIAR